MSRLNDVGGMHGFGPIEREADEPAFHHEWEARVFALNRVLLARGIYNLDEFRYAVERIDPTTYYGLSYYERWLAGIETLLREKGVLQ
jgi:nitrile hydratase subunit beta